MSKKHDASIKKDRIINLQIGIIALLCFSYFMYGVFSYKEVSKKAITLTIPSIDDDLPQSIGPVIPISNTVIAEVKAKPKVIKKAAVTKTISSEIPKIVDKIVEPIIKVTPTDTSTPSEKLTSSDTNTDKQATETTTSKGLANAKKPAIFSSTTVEFLPIFPGCNKYSTNNERAICFQEKVQRMVLRKFNSNLGEELGLSGKQTIFLYFEINEDGLVSNIRARSRNKSLSQEAERVARLLPKMKPARHGDTTVKMAYTLPISFIAK